MYTDILIDLCERAVERAERRRGRQGRLLVCGFLVYR